MQQPKVLMIGLRSDAVDFEKWPRLSAEKLEAAFERVLGEMAGAGFDARWCLTDTGETAEGQVLDELRAVGPDVVLIGAGLRTDPEHFLLFERVINAVHGAATDAKIAFNTLPYDSVEAVRRWV
ncbi:MAG: hypothetical protein AAF711_05570 [Planctomycetota bacterium]